MKPNESSVCSQCGKSMHGELPGRACPHCLIALAMDGGSDSSTRPRQGYPSAEAHVSPIENLVEAFPNLEIQHLIGHGGMGAVYQARQINLDRTIALKILSPRLSFDPSFTERFLREARLLAKLSHPNIVTVFDFGQAGEFYYLIMEFVDGVNLRDTILAKVLAPETALAIIPQVCEALQYAHDHGVVHRDIKPENILFARNGSIKIADFGLAKLLQPDPDQFTLTGTRQIMGTRNYMAPEQLEHPDQVDHRADLYSLGVVFYELLTGELPLGRFSLPSEKSAAVSRSLDDVVMRTLEKNPDRRYQQASHIRTACESIERPQLKGAIPQERDRNMIPLCRPIPITINQLYGGMATGYGLLRGFDAYLELEFEIRDDVISHKWRGAKVQVPLDKVAWIKLYEGLIYTSIEVQADHFYIVDEIPNSKQGRFRVYLKKEFRESAEQLVQTVDKILENTRGPVRPLPMPPVKVRNSDAGFSQMSPSNLPAAIVIFFILCLCTGIGTTIILGSIWLKSRHQPGPVPAHHVEQTQTVIRRIETSDAEKATDDGQDDAANSTAEVGNLIGGIQIIGHAWHRSDWSDQNDPTNSNCFPLKLRSPGSQSLWHRQIQARS